MLVMVLVIIGALIAISSGIWVAAALITAISSHPSTSSNQPKTNEKTTNQKT
jgi:hypothetical protein